MPQPESNPDIKDPKVRIASALFEADTITNDLGSLDNGLTATRDRVGVDLESFDYRITIGRQLSDYSHPVNRSPNLYYYDRERPTQSNIPDSQAISKIFSGRNPQVIDLTKSFDFSTHQLNIGAALQRGDVLVLNLLPMNTASVDDLATVLGQFSKAVTAGVNLGQGVISDRERHYA